MTTPPDEAVFHKDGNECQALEGCDGEHFTHEDIVGEIIDSRTHDPNEVDLYHLTGDRCEVDLADCAKAEHYTAEELSAYSKSIEALEAVTGGQTELDDMPDGLTTVTLTGKIGLAGPIEVGDTITVMGDFTVRKAGEKHRQNADDVVTDPVASAQLTSVDGKTHHPKDTLEETL